jgi:O-antigen/teichoic acid export membrane protein
LIPLFSYNGAAISTLISYLVMFLLIYYFSQKDFYIKYEWKKILIIWFICIIFVISGLILSAMNISYYLLITYKILSLITYLIILYKNNFIKIFKFK